MRSHWSLCRMYLHSAFGDVSEQLASQIRSAPLASGGHLSVIRVTVSAGILGYCDCGISSSRTVESPADATAAPSQA